MSTGARVAAAVGAGYLLGRTRKFKLAITVAGLMAGKRIATNPSGIARQAGELVESNPKLAELTDQVKGSLVQAGRTAAISMASRRIDSVSESLRERSDRWSGIEPADAEEAASSSAEDASSTAKKTSSAAKKTTQKASSDKKSSAKKPSAKKSSSKSSTKKSPAKKSSTKESPAKKSSSKSKSSSSSKSRS